MSQRILVTGANGFIGRYLCPDLEQAGLEVRRVARASELDHHAVQVNTIDEATDWSPILDGIDTIVHLAARVHKIHETEADPLAAFRKVNTDGTFHLAKSAVASGVKRFIFVSTIHVNGQETPADKPFTEIDPVRPQGPYAQSKWEAEQGLRRIEQETGMSVVIVRPPLVYGPDAAGNFAQLLKWTARSLPLPLGHTDNQRSLIFVRNLSSFLVQCVVHPQAAGELFLISDGQDLSTTELLRGLANGMNVSARLLPLPRWSVEFPLRLLKREKLLSQLWSSLRIDAGKATRLLGWSPPFSVGEGLRWTSEQYVGHHRRKQKPRSRK